MPDLPNSADIRQFLFDFFNDEELATLCFDFFPEVQDNFAAGMTKQQKILDLLGYCQRREIVPNLLAALQRVRPEPYIGFVLKPAEKLQHTRLVAGFEVAYEMVVWKELEGLATDHAQFVFDVVAVHEATTLDKVQPILFMGEKNFAALGDRWRFTK